jgi:hypothetical protein
MPAISRVSKEFTIGGVKVKLSGKVYGDKPVEYWTVKSNQLAKILAGGKMVAKCDGHYTDDYAWDNASNFGITDFQPVNADIVKKLIAGENMSARESGFGVEYHATRQSSCRSIWLKTDDNMIHLHVHSNLSYTIAEKVA